MNAHWVVACLMLAPLAGVPSEAAAQKARKPDRPHRSGFWVELGAGPSHLRVACACGDSITRAPGSGGYTRLGWIISDKVLMAWESAGFTDESFGFVAADTSIEAEMEATGLAVLWFPWKSGAFIKGGIGIAEGRFTVPVGAQADTVEGTGVGLSFGLGWDFALSRKYAITINAAAFVTAIGDLVLPGGRVDDVIGTMYQLTLGFTFR